MISETYSEDVFIADYTNYVIKSGSESELLYKGVVGTKETGIMFLELKYCEPKNLYSNMLSGIGQLRATCNYILKERQEYDGSQFKKYLVISTPGVEPLDPFDASYFNQDDMLTLKEDTGAILKAANEVSIQTPAVLKF